MKIALRVMRPGYQGMTTHAFLGAAAFCFFAVWDAGSGIQFPVRYWGIWLLILFAPFSHVMAYFGLKYFHLTKRIKSDSQRKTVTDWLRFWIMLSSSSSLLYAELEGDYDSIMYLDRYFSRVPNFDTRLDLSVTRQEGEINVVRIFSDKKISMDMGSTGGWIKRRGKTDD